MAGKHRVPKPSPYGVAAGCVAYAAELSFHKHIPVDLIAAVPAVLGLAVAAVEHGLAAVDPRMAPAVEARVDRLAEQAKAAAKDVYAVAEDVEQVTKVIEPEVKPLVG